MYTKPLKNVYTNVTLNFSPNKEHTAVEDLNEWFIL